MANEKRLERGLDERNDSSPSISCPKPLLTVPWPWLPVARGAELSPAPRGTFGQILPMRWDWARRAPGQACFGWVGASSPDTSSKGSGKSAEFSLTRDTRSASPEGPHTRVYKRVYVK